MSLKKQLLESYHLSLHKEALGLIILKVGTKQMKRGLMGSKAMSQHIPNAVKRAAQEYLNNTDEGLFK